METISPETAELRRWSGVAGSVSRAVQVSGEVIYTQMRVKKGIMSSQKANQDLPAIGVKELRSDRQ